MGKVVARIAAYSAFILFLLAGKVAGRHLYYDAAELVSDGLSDGAAREEESFLRLKGMDSSEEHCQQMYGFLPCSSNLPGHLFLIVVYEYLLYQGESYAGGDGRLFRVFGMNFFGATIFQLLDSLPDSVILLASGLLSSNEKTQEYVVTGVGLLAGSSILLLTVLWGICLICGRRKFPVKPGSIKNNSVLQLLTGYGVRTDSETSHHANIMLFSVIPFIIILIPRGFGVSYSSQVYNLVVLLSLSIAVICLFSYFFYQVCISFTYRRVAKRILCEDIEAILFFVIFYPLFFGHHFLQRYDKGIQKRRLEYAEVERKVEMHVPFYQVQELMLNRDKHLMRWQRDMEKMIASQPNEMKRDEFISSFTKWLDSTRRSMDDPFPDQSETDFNLVAQLLLEDKIKLMQLISRMMKDAFNHKENGTPDESAIDGYFEMIDEDGNSFISPSELGDFITSAKHEDILMDEVVDEEVVDIIMTRLDVDGDRKIDKGEFRKGITKWFEEIKAYNSQKNDENLEKARYQKWVKARADGKLKAIALVGVGVVMLMLLAEPLIQSVRIFSESVKIAPFYISFILVPLATNARTAIAAIRAAKQKRHHTTSLTFSEIYHKAFMNNILGFSVLVSVIYFRGLTWHFSVEVLVLVIVCAVMGLLARFNSKFPIWTLLIAFPLYPLSLVLVYFIDDTFKLT